VARDCGVRRATCASVVAPIDEVSALTVASAAVLRRAAAHEKEAASPTKCCARSRRPVVPQRRRARLPDARSPVVDAVGGESQRINLATSLGSALVGTLYVLDEPSIGLHSRDNQRLIDILQQLRDQGNTFSSSSTTRT
jgi:alpha-D-ribose 1-methylphosphonate 5-triphosphate synthase subunit PhnL